ncbi:MAG: Methyltransferase type 12 [Frankiales bacterium]|nr:Methyltransferase type 12 [Frankiales bacterium]
MAPDASPPITPRGQSPQLWSSLRATLDGFGHEPVSILDCGGGSGSLAVPLAAGGAELTVVDVSIDALGTLMRRAGEAGAAERITALQGEVESLSELLGDQTFDVVLAHEVLANVVDVAGALAQLVAALKPGGALSVVIGNPVAAVLGRALAGDVAGALTLLRRPAGLAGLDLESACVAAGLRVETVRGIGVFSELVPGIELERPGATTALAELERLTSATPPYRDIASRVHVIARKPGPSA